MDVSARIHALEKQLGAPLFRRHARGAALTNAGEQLLPYAERISRLVDEAQQGIGDESDPCGPLRIGPMETTARRVAGLDAVMRDPKTLVFRTGCSYRRRLESIPQARGAIGVRCMEFGTLDGILGCVGAGMGLTLLPAAVVERHASREQVRVHELPEEEARAQTVFVQRVDTPPSPALTRFLTHARAMEADTARPADGRRLLRDRGLVVSGQQVVDAVAERSRCPEQRRDGCASMTGRGRVATDAGRHDGSFGEEEDRFDHRHPGGVDPHGDLVVERLLV